MRPAAAGWVGAASFLLIGWAGLIVPSVIRQIQDRFEQSDAGLGVFYFLFAAAWAGGSFSGGFLTERLGRRRVLTLGGALAAAGFGGLGGAPSWPAFLALAVPAGLGAGLLDGGGNGLFLDLCPTARGRALNLLHLFFSIGALAAPVTIGLLVEGGMAWQLILVATGLAGIPIAVLYAVVPMPGGHRVAAPGPPGEVVAAESGTGTRLSPPLLLLALAIACYVASEVGVSSWLVRFLEPAPLATATLALTLYWAGIAVGRLVSARYADRFDHRRFTLACALGLGATLVGAILVPSLPVSIGLFALSGVASGPIFPMIVALGGERYPDRSAAVSGFLGGTAVSGSIIYPPVMGFMSVSVGLTVAMLGNAVLALAAAGALILVGRSEVSSRGSATGR
jgi:fucose permease